MKIFLQLTAVENSNNVECLRLFYDQIETSVQNLKTLGVEINKYGSLLIPLLTEKRPDDLRLRIAEKFENDVWDIFEILNLVKNELEGKERSSFMLSHTSDQYLDHTAAALLVKGGTEHKRACVFCNKENHISHKCLKVSDPKASSSILRRKKLSFMCFKGGHLSVNCSKLKDYKCKKCSAKHIISVCSRQAIPVATHLEELQNTNTTLANFNNKNILLQTAYAKLSSFNSNKTNDVRIIFDTGTQKTYVTNDVKKYLNLPTLPNLRNYAHLKNIKLADAFDADFKKIDILIGLDLYFKLMTGSVRPGNENEPIALESGFGWVVNVYYESSFLTTTNSFKNLFLNTSFYDIDHMKNDDSIFKLEKETLLLSSVNQMKVASLFLNLKTI